MLKCLTHVVQPIFRNLHPRCLKPSHTISNKLVSAYSLNLESSKLNRHGPCQPISNRSTPHVKPFAYTLLSPEKWGFPRMLTAIWKLIPIIIYKFKAFRSLNFVRQFSFQGLTSWATTYSTVVLWISICPQLYQFISTTVVFVILTQSISSQVSFQRRLDS